MNVTVKNILIALGSLYLIFVIERAFKKDTSPTELIIEHSAEKARMLNTIETLNNKVHDYELDLLKIRIDVDDMSNDQVDSTWSTIFN